MSQLLFWKRLTLIFKKDIGRVLMIYLIVANIPGLHTVLDLDVVLILVLDVTGAVTATATATAAGPVTVGTAHYYDLDFFKKSKMKY